MSLTLLRFAVLILILWYLPAFLLTYFGGSLGSLASFATSLGLLGYFILSKQGHRPLLPFVLLGLLYFLISGLNYSLVDEDNEFIKDFIRFMIVVVCSAAVLRRTSDKELFYLLLIGASSIIINAIFLPTMQPERFAINYGRYSGLYLNPNLAGGICLIGYSLSFAIKDFKWKLLGQIVFTLAGILTFSRTFIVIWVMLSILSIYNNKRNLVVPVIGVMLLTAVIVFSSRLTLNTERFSSIESIFTKEKTNTSALNKDSRDETWAVYYDLIFDKPFIGHGYQEFKIKRPGFPGVHNSFLLVIGEAGIVPFLLFLGIYLHLLTKSYSFIKSHPWYFYIVIAQVLALMGGHGYFTNFTGVIISMYVYIKLNELSSKQNSSLALPDNNH